MESKGEYRRWDELIPDTLGLIFRKLTLEETLMVVPRVCKSWRNVVNGPYCWQEIDIEEWSSRSGAQNIDRMLRMLFTRTCGSLRKLSVCELPSESFTLIAENASALKTLHLLRGHMTNSIVEQVTPKLTSITSLDLSYCSNLGACALESIGKHCKSLTWLSRNMHPGDRHIETHPMFGITSQADEAHAIATSMPNLKHLEIAYLLVNTDAVIEILNGCRSLETLDLRGCWSVNLSENVKEKFPKLKILGPHVVDDFEYDYSSAECSDDETYYDSDSTDGGFDDPGTFEFVIYHEGYAAAAGWPTSP